MANNGVSKNSGQLMTDLLQVLGAAAVILLALQMAGLITIYTPSRGNKNNQQPQNLQ